MHSAASEHPVDLKSTLGTVSGPDAKRHIISAGKSNSTNDRLMLGADLADNKSMKKSLYESRVTYKYQNNGGIDASVVGKSYNSNAAGFGSGVEQGSNSFSSTILSFSLVRSWASLAKSKCKLWDDEELDAIEGCKFFSFFLG